MIRLGKYQFLVTGLLVMGLGLGVFFFLKGLFDTPGSSYFQEIAAAVLGTVMITIVTMSLLGYQSNSEEKREKSLGIFQKKMEIYSGFLDFLYDMIHDGKLDSAEINQLSKWTTRVLLIAGAETALQVGAFTEQCIRFRKFRVGDLNKDEFVKWQEWYSQQNEMAPDGPDDFISVGEVIRLLRADLGDVDVANLEASVGGAFAADSLIDEMLQRKSQRPNATSGVE